MVTGPVKLHDQQTPTEDKNPRRSRCSKSRAIPRRFYPTESLVNSDQTWQQLTESTFERQKAFQRKAFFFIHIFSVVRHPDRTPSEI